MYMTLFDTTCLMYLELILISYDNSQLGGCVDVSVQ